MSVEGVRTVDLMFVVRGGRYEREGGGVMDVA